MAVALFAAVVALTLVIAGCGSDAKIGDGAEVAAAQGQVRPAGAGSVTGADATPQPDALTPTPTSTPASAPGLTPDDVSEPLAADATVAAPTRTPVASVTGAIVPRMDGQPGVAVAIYVEVGARGVSGIDITASVRGGAFAINGVTPGALLGDDVLVAVADADVGAGDGARLAFARKGGTPAEGASGEAATVLLDTVDADAIVGGLTVLVWVTDAGFVLHGPFEVTLDGDGL
jgi:hypothetical protein